MCFVKKNILYVAIVGMPFISSFNGIDALGGLGKQLSFYPMMLGLIIWGILIAKGGVVKIPQSVEFKIIVLFMLWLFFSGMINLPTFMDLNYQGVNGINRFIIQLGSFIFYVLISLVAYNWISQLNNPIKILRNGIYVSFFIAGLYSVMELIAFVSLDYTISAISAVDSVFRENSIEGFFLGRLRSVSAEASYFGMYAAMIMPWLVTGFLKANKNKIFYGVINGYFLILVFMTASRTAYLLIFLELLLMIVLFKEQLILNMKHMLIPLFIFVICIVCGAAQLIDKMSIDVITIMLSITDSSGENLSNIARYGSQLAALNIFLDNPVFGVGYGMFGFYAPDYYPSIAWYSFEVKDWGSNIIGGKWPPVHGLYARLLAETGGIGLIIWLLFIVFSVKRTFDVIALCNDDLKLDVKAILISLLASFACGFNVDGFIVIGMWIFIAYAWYLNERICNE